jgi:hypothetical protein
MSQLCKANAGSYITTAQPVEFGIAGTDRKVARQIRSAVAPDERSLNRRFRCRDVCFDGLLRSLIYHPDRFTSDTVIDNEKRPLFVKRSLAKLGFPGKLS